MSQRIIAIGDIHGCAQALRRLVAEIQPTTSDLIVPLGDFVDRGPDSRDVVEQLLKLERQCQLVPLLGNHELMMLQALNDVASLRFWLECGGLATIESYGEGMDIPETHVAFLQRCCRFVETDNFVFVHANYDARLPWERQPDRLLFWEHVFSQVPDRHRSGKPVIVGHTPQVSGEILDLGHLICIDTYCVGGGWLTALELETNTVWQVNKAGELRSRDR
jgi:serine/threonine protein phosphatase 1